MASKRLQELRVQLKGQTRDIQNLQQEVEHATKCVIEKLSIPYHDHCNKPATAVYEPSNADSSYNSQMVDCTLKPQLPLYKNILQSSLPLDAMGNPINRNLLSNCYCVTSHQRCYSSNLNRQHIEKDLKDYSSQVKDSQTMLNQSTNLHEKQNFQTQHSVNELEGEIQKVEKKRESIMDTRNKVPESEGKISRPLHVTIHELKVKDPVQEEMLKQSNIINEQLKVLHTWDKILKDIQVCLVSYEVRYGKNICEQGPIACLPFSKLHSAVDKALYDLDGEVSMLKKRLLLKEDQFEFLQRELQNKEALLKEHQESNNNLNNQHEQEVAALTEECKSFHNQAQSVQTQVETMQKQARDQNVKYEEQISNLKSEVSELESKLRVVQTTCKDKVEDYKKQLVTANSGLKEARDEQSRCSQELGNLDCQFKQLSEKLQKCEQDLIMEKEQSKQLREQDVVNSLFNEHLQKQVFERSVEVQRLQDLVKSLAEEKQRQSERQIVTLQEKNASLEITTIQLESAKMILLKTAEELASKNQSLGIAEKSLRDLKTLMDEKEVQLKTAWNEQKRSHSEVQKIKKIKGQLQMMQLQLTEKDQLIKTVQDKVDNMTQMIEEQSQKSNTLQIEKSGLLEAVSGQKAEIQEIKTVLENKERRIRELEEFIRRLNLEKEKHIKLNSANDLAAKELKMERDQLRTELKAIEEKFSSLAENYEVLKRDHRNRNGETASTMSVLKMQLRATVAELEQTKNTLKSMEGCDGQAMKIATGMQKKITAKRTKIDVQKSRIQFLEEALSDTTKDKLHFKAENNKLMHELSQEAAEKRKLSAELENLKTENYTLKENVANIERDLEKALLQFSECQDINQHLEQEAVRLKLQHTLDLKEMKWPNITATTKPIYMMGSDSAIRLSLQTQQFNAGSKNPLVEKPTRDINQFSKEFLKQNTGEVSIQKPAMNEDISKKPSVPYRTSDPLTLYTGDPEHKDRVLPENPLLMKSWHNSSPKLLSKEIKNRPKSPVHALLTSSADNYDFTSNSQFSTAEMSPKDSTPVGDLSTDASREVCQRLKRRIDDLQNMAEDLQTKNKAMSSMIRKQGRKVLE